MRACLTIPCPTVTLSCPRWSSCLRVAAPSSSCGDDDGVLFPGATAAELWRGRTTLRAAWCRPKATTRVVCLTRSDGLGRRRLRTAGTVGAVEEDVGDKPPRVARRGRDGGRRRRPGEVCNSRAVRRNNNPWVDRNCFERGNRPRRRNL